MGLGKKLLIAGAGLAGALGLWQLGSNDGSRGPYDLGRNVGRIAEYSGDKTDIFTEVFDDLDENIVDGNVLGLAGRGATYGLLGLGAFGLYRLARRRYPSAIDKEIKNLREEIAALEKKKGEKQ